MNQFLVYHQSCPKNLSSVSPAMQNVTKNPQDHPADHKFEIRKCDLCGMEIIIHYGEKYGF